MNIFHTRNHRYRISVKYIDDKFIRFGKTEPLIVNRDTVDIFIKAFNPIKGGYISITKEQVDDGIRILKNIRIERN